MTTYSIWELLYSIGKVLLRKEILIKNTLSKIDQVGLNKPPGYSTDNVKQNSFGFSGKQHIQTNK